MGKSWGRVLLVAAVLSPGPCLSEEAGRGRPRFDEFAEEEWARLPIACQQKCKSLYEAWNRGKDRIGAAFRDWVNVGLKLEEMEFRLKTFEHAGVSGLEQLRDQIERTKAEQERRASELEQARQATAEVKQDLLECVNGCYPSKGFNPAWVVVPTVLGGGAAVALTNGDDPPASATPPVRGPGPNPVPSTPPPAEPPSTPPPAPSSIGAQVLVIEAGGTRVLNGTATGPMNGTNHQTLHRQTNNCANFFFPNFPIELRVTGTGGPATGPAEAIADGNFSIDGSPITAHIVVGVNVPGGKPIVKTYELGKRQNGVMCTDAFLP